MDEVVIEYKGRHEMIKDNQISKWEIALAQNITYKT